MFEIINDHHYALYEFSGRGPVVLTSRQNKGRRESLRFATQSEAEAVAQLVNDYYHQRNRWYGCCPYSIIDTISPTFKAVRHWRSVSFPIHS